MRNTLPLLLSALLLGSFTSAAGWVSSPLMANIQDSTSNLIRQADALLAAGHPAQAAALYLGAGDAAAAAHQLDAAAAAYQKAADAFHLANDPGHEATAYDRAGDVYMKQAGVTLPAAGQPAPPAGAPAPTVHAPPRQAPQTAPAPPAAPKAGSTIATSGGIRLIRDATIGTKFGAPGPRSCSSMNQPSRGPLSADQARAYVICGYEEYHQGSELLYLLGQVQVQVSKARPYEHIRDSFEQIDPHQPVYDIRGTSVTYVCSLPSYRYPDNRRCMRTVDAHDEGVCYQTNFNEWRCTWVDRTSTTFTDSRLMIPPPRASEVE